MSNEISPPAALPAPEEFGVEWMVEDHGTGGFLQMMGDEDVVDAVEGL